MARVNIAAQTTPGAYPTLPVTANSLDLAMQALDASLGNYTALVDSKTFVLAQNTGVGARTITFTSVADAFGRTGDITAYSIGAGELAIFGPFKAAGWSQSGTQLYIDGSHAEVKAAVITLP